MSPAGKISARLDSVQHRMPMLWSIGHETGGTAPLVILPLKGVMAKNSRTEAKVSRGRDSMGGKTSPIMLKLELPVGWDELTSTGSGVLGIESRITHHVRMKVCKPTGGDIII